MTTIYTKPQIDAMAVKIGVKINESKTEVVQTQGQSTTQAVSQKLFTNTVGDIGAALDAINGVAV